MYLDHVTVIHICHVPTYLIYGSGCVSYVGLDWSFK